MSVKKELLEILCCPVTQKPVEVLPADKLARLNKLIESGSLKNIGGAKIEQAINEALITVDGKIIYRIDEDIPVMLSDEGISADDIADF